MFRVSILWLFISGLFTYQVRAQNDNFIGLWGTTLDYEGEQSRIVLGVKKETHQKYKGWLQNIDNTSDTIFLENFSINSEKISFSLEQGQSISFQGKILNDSSINGELIIKQGKIKLESWKITFVKILLDNEIYQVKRPQTPYGPFEYDLQEISFFNKKDSIQLCGVISKPSGNGPFPGIVIISGSGRDDRDGTEDFHKRWLVIGDWLTKKGYVVLRFDEREVGCSQGDYDKATTEDFANDVKAGIEFLKKQVFMDTTHIGLLGHSEGAIIAPLIAHTSNSNISFLILLGTPT